jgi:hypothetical protein
MAHRDQSVSFRFLALSPPQFDALRQHRADVTSRPARGRAGRVTGGFDLCEDGDYAWMKPFIALVSFALTDALATYGSLSKWDFFAPRVCSRFYGACILISALELTVFVMAS